MLDVLMIKENKIDESFPVAQFALNGFNLYRYDHTERSVDLYHGVRPKRSSSV